MNRYVQPMFVRPSGYATSGISPWPALAGDPERVRFYQRILMGQGFDVGPQGASGVYNQTTADAVRRFQIAYNNLPGSQRRDPTEVVVNAQLTAETQAALNQRANGASNSVVPQVPVDVDMTNVRSFLGGGNAYTPTAETAAPGGASWGTVALVAGGVLLVGTAIVLSSSGRKSR